MMSNRFLTTFSRHAYRRWDEPPTGLIGILLDWTGRARQRRALADLSDTLLRDVGLTRADVEAEATKPFWRV